MPGILKKKKKAFSQLVLILISSELKNSGKLTVVLPEVVSSKVIHFLFSTNRCNEDGPHTLNE